jgi:hypothetical protein
MRAMRHNRRMSRSIVRCLAIALCAGVLAACAGTPTLRSEVTRFHAWQAAEPLSYAIRTPEPATGILEHRSYVALLRERLRALGFVESPAATARYALEFSTTLVPEVRRYTDWSWPGAWPGYGGFGPGPWPVRPGAPYLRADPAWGLPPVPMARDETVARHELRVALLDTRAGDGQTVWEARATAYAASEAWPKLMPGLVASVFSDFPGESGATRRIEVPLPQR